MVRPGPPSGLGGGGVGVRHGVRSDEEWSEGHVPGAIHLPDGEARTPKDLRERGYDAVAVDGGMDDWIAEDFNVQPTEDPDEDTELGLG
jgi:rhodanese-related sulfurtransferase